MSEVTCACGSSASASNLAGWQVDAWAQSGFWCPNCKPAPAVYAEAAAALVSFGFARSGAESGQIDYRLAIARVEDLEADDRRELVKLLRRVADQVENGLGKPRNRELRVQGHALILQGLRAGTVTKTEAIGRIAPNLKVLERLTTWEHSRSMTDAEFADVLAPYCLRDPRPRLPPGVGRL